MKKHTPKKTQRIIKAFAVVGKYDGGSFHSAHFCRENAEIDLRHVLSPSKIVLCEIHLPAPQRVKKTPK